jgi:ribonuclease G
MGMENKELIINTTPTGAEIALIENNRLVEIQHQKTSNNFMVGDIYIAKVRKLMPALNAVFIDIGPRKDSFLHYTDLGAQVRTSIAWTQGVLNGSINTAELDKIQFEDEIVKTGKIEQVFAKKPNILVQILKEPISTKGPRLSCEVTIPGRYMVLVPFSKNNDVNVSKKINSAEERKRLQNLAESIKPKNFGLILRTAAEGKNVKDLHEEIQHLLSRWDDIFAQLKSVQPPGKLLSELDKPASILRDLLSDSFSSIVVNDKELFLSIKNYLQTIAPDQVKILSFYSDKRPIMEAHGVTRQLKASFGKNVTLGSGAYIIIEKTEAMHVIDVNSGHKMGSGSTENSVMGVNIEAATEIARQIRLRDIGGLITIDFIDMRDAENKKLLYKRMQDLMETDRAQHTILPLSKFGLMQITRERVRPEIELDTSERCPSCNGTGTINASIIITDEIERDLEFILDSRQNISVTLKVHPFIDAFLKRKIISQQVRWYMKYKRWVKIVSEPSLPITSYKFFDRDDEIRLN